MPPEIRTTDAEGRLSLPKSFANWTVIVEQVSETEVRIRRVQVVAEDDLPFEEESVTSFNDEARDQFLELLANPPVANRALQKAAARHKRRRG